MQIPHEMLDISLFPLPRYFASSYPEENIPVTAWWQASINYWYLRQFYYEPDADVELLTRELAGKKFSLSGNRILSLPIIRQRAYLSEI